MDGWLHEQLVGWMNVMNVWINGWKAEWMNWCMDERMKDGWMDMEQVNWYGWMDEWIDGWMNK